MPSRLPLPALLSRILYNGGAMSEKSMAAYNVPERVAVYERAMDVMHPNRHEMARVAAAFTSLASDAPLRLLDIGSGTGFFVGEWLRAFPEATAVALDGAEAMVEVASERLGTDAARVDFRTGDFRKLGELTGDGAPYDVVISMYALHHLDRADKVGVVADAVSMMKPGAWFVNADVIVGATPYIEERNQALRVQGIVERVAGELPEYRDRETTRATLDAMEAAEGDQPLPVAVDLEILGAAGLDDVAAVWLYHRESVTVGRKTEEARP